MHITNVTWYPMWAGHRNYTTVVVDTDEGIYGLGEAGLTGRERAIVGALEHLKELIVGQDPFRSEYLWQLMSRGGFFPHGRVLGAAMAAIDIALWDIKGKALGVPIYELLGGRVRDRVACYCHIGGETLEHLLHVASQRVDEGWRFLRWSLPTEDAVLEPTRAMRRGVEGLRALRAKLGDDIELCFDVHTRLSPADAIWFCRQVAPLRLFFVEDPIRSESPQAFHLLRDKVETPLAAGEQFASKWEFRELIDHDLVDYARVDLCIAGGLTEARKLAGWCEAHYIDMAVHNPLGPVSTAACLHYNLAIPNFGVQEQPRLPDTVLADVVRGQPTWEAGSLLPPTGPGLGLSFDREAASEHSFRMVELPHLMREDGSLTNW